MSLLLATSGDIASGVVEPEGVDFDGVNDYLSRSSDLVGNVDSKTFTFSAWVYVSNDNVYVYGSSNGAIFSYTASNGNLGVYLKNSVGTTILSATASKIQSNTFTHVLVSLDLANTSHRYIYLNDVLTTPTWATFTNDSINFTDTNHYINNYNTGNDGTCRLSNIFLDYTYRDLSIEANRRLFITADGKPT